MSAASWRDVLEDDLDARPGATRRRCRRPSCRRRGRRPSHRARLDVLGAAAAAVDGLEVEEERLDHVLRDLRGHQLDEVAGLDLERGVEVDLGALDGGGEDVARRRVGGALDLLAQVGREGGQVGGERGRGRGAAGDLVARDVPGLLGLGVGVDEGARPATSSSRGRGDLVDQAVSSACSGRSAGPGAAPCSSASAMPSRRTVRSTPPPPGSRPRVTSGKPISAWGRRRSRGGGRRARSRSRRRAPRR